MTTMTSPQFPTGHINVMYCKRLLSSSFFEILVSKNTVNLGQQIIMIQVIFTASPAYIPLFFCMMVMIISFDPTAATIVCY